MTSSPESRQSVRVLRLTNGLLACVDCLGLGHAREGEGRPARCAAHRKEFRAWYQRRWRYEQRHGPGSYPEEYSPAWVHPATAPAVIALSEADALDEVVASLRRSVAAALGEVHRSVRPDDRAFFVSKLSEFARASNEIERISSRLRGR